MAVAWRLVRRAVRSNMFSRYALTGICSRYFEMSDASASTDSYLKVGSAAMAFLHIDRNGRGRESNALSDLGAKLSRVKAMTAPSEKMSDLGLAASPRSCSGAMKPGVPTTPVAGGLASARA